MPEPLHDIPVTVVTGFLGVGKTTTILNLFEHRPPDERWAVLVNEFGEVGLDGPILESGGIAVKEIPGGCICCSAGLELKVGLVRLLREVRPDRLLVEPTGLAHPATIIDILRTPGLREAVRAKAVIGLVDPRQFLDPRYRERENYRDQVQISDVLVANRTDQCTPEQLADFREAAGELYPPKLDVLFTEHGHIDPKWLDVDPSPKLIPLDVPHQGVEGSQGWVWPAHAAWDRRKLEDTLHALVRPGDLLPDGVLRLKGIFRTRSVWLLVQATSDEVVWRPIHHRRDSRVEMITPNKVDDAVWQRVREALEAATLRL